MNTVLYAITGVAIVVGLGVSIWSFIDTRRRFYEDYVKRRGNDKKHIVS